MRTGLLATLTVVIGMRVGGAWAELPSVPGGEWTGDITSHCTVHDTDADLMYRHPHIDVQCSSGRCFAQLSLDVYKKDPGGIVEFIIPGMEHLGNRMTVIGWGPIFSRTVEQGNAQGGEGHEREEAEAYLDGLTVVFLPNDDLSVSIDHAMLACGGILLPKL